MCIESVNAVLSKRESSQHDFDWYPVRYIGRRKQPFCIHCRKSSKDDEGLYGIDEILALSIVNVYGSIGFTNYGYIDKVKPGILKELNSHEGPRVHTFLDDIVGAIAASAASRLAHQHPSKSHYITQ